MTTHKVTTFIKQYFFLAALAAMFVGFSAFKANTKAFQSFYWYEADEATGQISDTQIDPEALCGGQSTLCAIGFSDDHYNVGPGQPAPIDNVSELSEEDPAGYRVEMKN